jgi:hypothetical protein
VDRLQVGMLLPVMDELPAFASSSPACERETLRSIVPN